MWYTVSPETVTGFKSRLPTRHGFLGKFPKVLTLVFVLGCFADVFVFYDNYPAGPSGWSMMWTSTCRTTNIRLQPWGLHWKLNMLLRGPGKRHWRSLHDCLRYMSWHWWSSNKSSYDFVGTSRPKALLQKLSSRNKRDDCRKSRGNFSPTRISLRIYGGSWKSSEG